ncbi:MAG: folylpolyglutamate synthase/dihydrofolate synthase family protein [Flavobacteriaceae bacterium]
MTYTETLAWMFAQLPMYQQMGKIAFNGKLDNIKAFTDSLDNPEKKFKSIHVAGTNGKGSCSHMLASILQEAGYKVGLYTSPHLKDFRERIRINGKPLDKKFVIDFIEQNKPFLEGHGLSFFEMSVGMAFDYFAREKVDIAIVEVGLGGRLDSTNIITPKVSLITNIGMDHLEILGDNLKKIALEKAGIIKENVPVVISEYQEETANTFSAIAKKKGCKIIFADKIVQKEYKTSLLGNYQSRNVKGVIAVLGVLNGFNTTEEHLRAGLRNVVKNTGLMGRWQVLQQKPMLVCDTAHNLEGLSLVLEQIHKEKFEALHIVLGFVKAKNLGAILSLFPKAAYYYFCRPRIPRGLDQSILEVKANEYGLRGKSYSSVSEAITAAKSTAAKADFIYVGGSNFVVAEVV